eukprot:GHVR01043458.1.p1 GENE.GHVR01043458.1~~GHVR01043458.1.p1  ORF type:complete len:381 (+),score=51.36 GHVR01043458.1:491-1633(+)
MVLLLWFVIVAYIIGASSLVTPVANEYLPHSILKHFPKESAEQLIKVLVVILMGPISYLRNLSALSFVTIVSFSSACFLGFGIMYRLIPVLGTTHTTEVWVDEPGMSVPVTVTSSFDSVRLWPKDFMDLLYVLPSFTMGLICQPSVLPMHGELVDPSRPRLRLIFVFAVIVALLLYLIIGAGTFMYAQEYTCSDLLKNFPPTDKIITGGRIAIALTLSCNISLLLLPLRASIYKSSQLIKDARNGKWVSIYGDMQFDRVPMDPSGSQYFLDDAEDESPKEMSTMTLFLITTALLLSCLITSIFLKSIMSVWSLAGSVCASLYAFIFPSLFYIRIRRDVGFTFRKFLAMVMFIMCNFIMVFATYQAVIKISQNTCPAPPSS